MPASPNQGTDIGALLNEGEARLVAEDWDGAIAIFRQAVAAAPTSALAHSKVGVALVQRKQWEDARAEFTQAIQLDPRYAPAHSNLGNVCHEQGRLDEAIACYQKAIAIDPDYWVAHQNLGIVYKQQGRIGEAVREFKISTRLSVRAKPDRLDPGQGGTARRARMGCLGTGGMAALVAAALILAALAFRTPPLPLHM